MPAFAAAISPRLQQRVRFVEPVFFLLAASVVFDLSSQPIPLITCDTAALFPTCKPRRESVGVVFQKSHAHPPARRHTLVSGAKRCAAEPPTFLAGTPSSVPPSIAPLVYTCATYVCTYDTSSRPRNHRVFHQTEHAVCVAPRNLGLDVPPEGLEPFFCPCLPGSGRGLCACPPFGQRGTQMRRHLRGHTGGAERRGGSSSGAGCSGAGLSPPPPRLFTFAAPGRSGTGIFYGACLSVFR